MRKGEELTPRIPNLHVQAKKADQPVIVRLWLPSLHAMNSHALRNWDA